MRNDTTEATMRAISTKPHQASASDQDIVLAAKGGGIAFVGNLFVYVIRFAFGIVMARLLGAELLGLYSLSLTIVSVVGILSSLGLSAGMSRYIPIAISKKDEARLWGTIQVGVALPFITSLALAIGMFALARPLCYQVFERPDMVPVLRLACLVIPLLSLMSVLEGIVQGFKRMEYIVYETVSLNLSKLVLSALLIWVGLSVMGAMIGHIVTYAMALTMLFYFVHRLFPLTRPLHTAKRNIGEILRFTLPLYLSRVLRRFSGSIETLVLGFIGVMSGVGIYTTVMSLSSIGKMFHTALQKITVPMISDLHSRGKLDQLARVYQTTTKWGMMFNLPIFLVIAIFAGPLLTIFGSDFVTGATSLIILAFATLFNASTGVCGSVITMTGHSKLTFVNSIVYLIINIALDLFFIPRWGIVGAAMAVTLSSVAINILRVIQVFALLRLWPYNHSFLKPIIAAIVAAGVTHLANQWLVLVPALLQVTIGTLLLGGLYVLMIVLLKLSVEDRLVLGRLLNRFNIKWTRI